MDHAKVVLITGVGGYWGARLAAQLVNLPGLHVIGLDVEAPRESIKGLDFIQADIRNPLLPELLNSEQVDTVCHLAFQESERPSEAAFDYNVMGTIKVLGACADVGVRKAVLKSSMEVYGARPDNSAFLTEDHPLRPGGRTGYIRDLVEMEAFVNGFQREASSLMITALRFSGIVGPTVDTPLTRFLSRTRTPTLFGFDPRLQVIHEDDVINALTHVVINDAPGVYNVAADGILPLSQVMALAGKLALPVFHLFAYWGRDLLSGARDGISRYLPIDPDYLRYSWVGDLTLMRERLGFVPHYTAEEALREFAGRQRLRRYLPGTAALAYDEERLRDTLERRRRAREQATRMPTTSEGQEVMRNA